MRIAVFSDIHGNPYACEALLESIGREGALDALVAAGDLCLGGSDPSRVVEMLRSAGVIGVYGNTEEYLKAPNRTPPDELHQKMWKTIQPAVFWTRELLLPDQAEWLFGLPFELHFSPDGCPENDLLVVHANPKDVELMILPDEEAQRSLFGEVRQPDRDPELTTALEGVTARTLAFGHFHYIFQRLWRDLELVGVASCSLPGFDHDLPRQIHLDDLAGECLAGGAPFCQLQRSR